MTVRGAPIKLPGDVTRAAEDGDVAVVAAFLAHPAWQGGLAVNARNVFQTSLVHIASKYNQLEVLALVLRQEGVDLNALDYGGMRRTALHWACQRGHLRCVELLVEAGADTEVEGKAWCKLVQGRKCGTLVDASKPFEAISDLCRSSTLRLALTRPRWSPSTHAKYPPSFCAAVRSLLMVVHVSRRARAAGDAVAAAAAADVANDPDAADVAVRSDRAQTGMDPDCADQAGSACRTGGVDDVNCGSPAPASRKPLGPVHAADVAVDPDGIDVAVDLGSGDSAAAANPGTGLAVGPCDGAALNGDPPQHAACRPLASAVADLPTDVWIDILSRAAFPLSAWLSEEELRDVANGDLCVHE